MCHYNIDTKYQIHGYMIVQGMGYGGLQQGGSKLCSALSRAPYNRDTL